MSYCLKTGGLLVDETEGCAYECDLHIVGNCVVAVTCPPDYDFDIASPYITLTIPTGGHYFYRAGKPYGMLVVQQSSCRASPMLRKPIEGWYNDYPPTEFL